ncbi:transposase [Undibacterium jejuense]|uniref:Transposase n=1 Tax=Undibacterium jejuense TaxID=1344949 RepID=A0A923KPY7_9BURK|nr:transposase [Undibacterium jejuense]MBC3863323.1 transposase [Undibacterium jejuense]
MLTQFETKWGKDYQTIAILATQLGTHLITPFFDYQPKNRKAIHTTDAMVSINMSLRKVIKTRSSFPTDDLASTHCFT